MRVVAGTYRGRRLRAPAGLATRPTAERVREALFDILGEHVVRARVLDAYAGSGSLGIEALSRGADSVVFVDSSRQAVAAIQANLASLGLAQSQTSRIIVSPLERATRQLSRLGLFDLWLVDPPFALVRDRSVGRALSTLMTAGLLQTDGMVVLEFPSDEECPCVEGLEPEEIRHYGDSRLAFLRHQID